MTEPQSRTLSEQIAYIEQGNRETRAFVEKMNERTAALGDAPFWHPFALGSGVFLVGMIAGRFLLP